MMSCNYYAICDENLIDLLSEEYCDLHIMENLRQGPIIVGLAEKKINNASEFKELLQKGRLVKQSKCSGSFHAILTLKVQI